MKRFLKFFMKIEKEFVCHMTVTGAIQRTFQPSGFTKVKITPLLVQTILNLLFECKLFTLDVFFILFEEEKEFVTVKLYTRQDLSFCLQARI